MTIMERVLELLKENGKEQKDLSDYLGITQQRFSDWKAERVRSYLKYIDKIADFFGVSSDYLLGNTETKYQIINKNDKRIAKDDTEEELLVMFRSRDLTPQDKELIKENIRNTIDLFLKSKGINIDKKDN
jgi:transcriptional regulator with XRE-family HTH domain